ncbi:hypothetical protein [Streptomyces sp. KR55]|uniref:hypothetical protein n=1 Tax=Streptomyces sp. KR55 TaxID=3457425 RepID=UPI003FD6895B
MNTKLVNTAAGVIHAAMQNGKQTSTETAAEFEQLQTEVAELKEQRERRRVRLVACEADLMEMRGLLSPNGFPRRIPPEVEIHERVAPAVEWLLNRVAELEAKLTEYERPADEDPIAFSPTVEASCGRALATGEPCPDHPEPQYAPDVTPQVEKLRALLAGQRDAVAAEPDGITRRIAPTQALRVDTELASADEVCPGNEVNGYPGVHFFKTGALTDSPTRCVYCGVARSETGAMS